MVSRSRVVAGGWIVAVTVGLAVGGFAFHFPGSWGDSEAGPASAVFGFLIGAVNGLLVGVLAAVALRLSRPDATRLLGTMVIVVGVTHALNDGSSSQLPFPVVQAIAGLATAGAFAWRLDERRVPTLAVIGAAWTLKIVLAGWSGDRIGLPLSETPIGWSMDHAWDGLVTGLVWGAATAIVGVPATLRARRATAGAASAPAAG